MTSTRPDFPASKLSRRLLNFSGYINNYSSLIDIFVRRIDRAFRMEAVYFDKLPAFLAGQPWSAKETTPANPGDLWALFVSTDLIIYASDAIDWLYLSKSWLDFFGLKRPEPARSTDDCAPKVGGGVLHGWECICVHRKGDFGRCLRVISDYLLVNSNCWSGYSSITIFIQKQTWWRARLNQRKITYLNHRLTQYTLIFTFINTMWFCSSFVCGVVQPQLEKWEQTAANCSCRLSKRKFNWGYITDRTFSYVTEFLHPLCNWKE